MIRWEKINFPWRWMGRNEHITPKEYQRRVQLFEQIVKYFGFDRIALPGSVGSYERLLFGKRSYNNVKYKYGVHFDNIPDNDHGRLFKKQGTNNIVYVNQPYGFDLEELETWCNERNLIYVVCDKSWSFYYPDVTEMILIMSEDTYVDYIEEINDFPQRLEEEKK